MASRIEDYALIGDCRSAALVSRNGSIEWLCWPRFDSPACFAALLGTDKNGYWRIAPTDKRAPSTHAYVRDTLIVETRFETGTGVAVVLDFMARDTIAPTLVRVVRGERGSVEMAMQLALRFDYGLTVPWASRGPQGELTIVAGPSKVILRTPAQLVGRDMCTHAKFMIHEGEEIPFVLQYAPSTDANPPPCDWKASHEHARDTWREWAGRCSDDNPWYESIKRSLLTLKALTFRESGGIVAAATTSLPEFIGGVRNWDYRICWLRDSSFTLEALLNAGYREEAIAWRDWLVRAVAGSPDQVQIMYGLSGERLLAERELPWLRGYEKSAPVRIGNAASEQRQLDVFGEVLNALYRTHAHAEDDVRKGARRPKVRPIGRLLLKHLETIWREPDEGIWEMRGVRRHFVHSKIMAWVAFDRGIRGMEQFHVEHPLDRWKAIRAEIFEDVCRYGFDEKVGAFVQYYGGDTVDASVLLAPIVGFLPADDPRIVSTVKCWRSDCLRAGS